MVRGRRAGKGDGRRGAVARAPRVRGEEEMWARTMLMTATALLTLGTRAVLAKVG